MASSNPFISTVRATVSAIPKRNPARRKKPSPLPLRPLEPDHFRPPRGQKQVFLPNFTLTFLRPPPTQPANFASFLTPLWMNKLDLKDYLYHLYGVEALHIRSHIVHGKVVRDVRTRQLHRTKQKKKMMIEMKAGDNFVWPEVPEDIQNRSTELRDAIRKQKKEMEEGRSPQGQYLHKVGENQREGLREKARALLQGKLKWKSQLEETGGGMLPLGGETRPSVSA